MSRNITAIATASRTATNNSGIIINSGKGCNIVIDMTAITATGSVTFKMEGYDPTSGKYYTILESAAVTTVSTNVLKILPSITEVANETISNSLPQNIRVTATHLNAVAMTYSVGINYIR